MDNDTYLDNLANVINKAGSTPDAISGIIEYTKIKTKRRKRSSRKFNRRNTKRNGRT